MSLAEDSDTSVLLRERLRPWAPAGARENAITRKALPEVWRADLRIYQAHTIEPSRRSR